MAEKNLLKMAEQKFQSAAEKIAKDLIATCYKEPQTNADRIRAMSDEELAEFLCGVYDEENGGVYQDEFGKFINGTIIIDYDQYKIAEWLKQPADMRGEEDAKRTDL